MQLVIRFGIRYRSTSLYKLCFILWEFCLGARYVADKYNAYKEYSISNMKSFLSFVAIISRDNKPILLKDFDREGDTSMHFVVHSALDVLEDNSDV